MNFIHTTTALLTFSLAATSGFILQSSLKKNDLYKSRAIELSDRSKDFVSQGSSLINIRRASSYTPAKDHLYNIKKNLTDKASDTQLKIVSEKKSFDGAIESSKGNIISKQQKLAITTNNEGVDPNESNASIAALNKQLEELLHPDINDIETELNAIISDPEKDIAGISTQQKSLREIQESHSKAEKKLAKYKEESTAANDLNQTP